MRLRFTSIVLSALFLLPVAVLARDHDSGSVDIPNRVSVAGHQLKPGHYKVDWQQTGPRVRVNFIRDGKIVATAPATLKTNDSQVMQDDVVTRKTASNNLRLMEIDMVHQKEALIFRGESQS